MSLGEQRLISRQLVEVAVAVCVPLGAAVAVGQPVEALGVPRAAIVDVADAVTVELRAGDWRGSSHARD